MHHTTNVLKTTLVLAGLGGLLVVVGGAIFGSGGAIFGLALGLLFAGGSYWFSDKLAIKAAGARPASESEMPEYYSIVRELAQKASMPMPRLFVSPSPQPNAFATGRNPDNAAVAVTDGIVRQLSWDELRGVLAHELSHVKNRDILISSIAAAIAMGITFVARMAMFGAMFGGGGDDEGGGNIFGLLLLSILAPVAAFFLQMALSRSREFEADRSGARLLGDGEALARALAKIEDSARRTPMNVDQAHASLFIVNPLTGRNIQFKNLFLTHPPTSERIARLRSGQWRA